MKQLHSIIIPGIVVFLAIVLIIANTWLGVEKARLAYQVEQYKGMIREKTEFITKLETERDLLLAPSRLIEYAKQFHLQPAQKGHIRTIALPQQEQEQEQIIIPFE